MANDWKITGGEYILTLYKETVNNTLVLTVGTADPQQHTVQWSWDDALQTAILCDKLLSQLQQIGKVYKQLGPTREDNIDLLSPELLDIWDIFVRPLDPPNYNRKTAEDIERRMAADEDYTIRERAYARRFRYLEKKEALKRLPNGRVHPLELIRRANRYARLVSLNAPEIICKNEKRMFARAFVLFLWTKVEEYDEIE